VGRTPWFARVPLDPLLARAMLEVVKLTAPGRCRAALLMLCAALPALAGMRFQVRRMTRDDVPLGKGQCDIRLQVDNEVEVSVRGDLVAIRTISGRDARDDGSECNAPLPDRDIVGFNFQVVDSRNEIRLLAEPSRRNGFAAIVRIRDSSGGEGRYHFRLSWAITGSDYGRPGGGNDRPPSPRDDNFDRTQGAAGFSWNNTVSFRGKGQGTASMNNSGEMRLGEVTIEIDRGGKLLASFRTEGRGRPISFTGQILASEGGRWKADVMSEDHRLRGPMWISVDDRRQVNSITLEATDGRDRMRLNWDRR
jgi:hypothetical protein